MLQETFGFQLVQDNFYASSELLIGFEPGFDGDPRDDVFRLKTFVIRAKQNPSCEEVQQMGIAGPWIVHDALVIPESQTRRNFHRRQNIEPGSLR
jgi:hypothetical protein